VDPHKIVSHAEWLDARKRLLAKERELTHRRDALARERRELPWERVEKRYVFEGPAGKETLAELFGAHGQLVVYHFMYGPEWEEPCKSCSFWADSFDRIGVHLAHRDVSFVAASRAPYAKLETQQRRFGWTFTWVSSFGSDFNYDFNVSFRPEEVAAGRAQYNFRAAPEWTATVQDLSGRSVFYKNETGEIFHTYTGYARGGEEVLGIYGILDAMPKGRSETGPYHTLADWARPRNMYGKGGEVEANGRYHAPSCGCAVHGG